MEQDRPTDHTHQMDHQYSHPHPVAEAANNPPQPYAPGPVLPPTQTPAATVHQHSAGLLVLQWLTYAFWGWTVFALSALTSTVVTSFMAKSTDTGGFTPYGIAAILVLLPISFLCDLFYSKKETPQKTGAAMAIMVIHAVLFALFAIGALITAVFAQVSMLTSNSDTETQKILIVCSLIIFVYYVVTFLRVLNLAKMSRYRAMYRIGMLVTVGIIIVLAIVGPAAKERSLRNDKLIENNLSSLTSNIDDYTRAKNKLPQNLDDLDLKGDAKALVDKNLVEYKTEELKQTTIELGKPTYASDRTIYYYELCVTYKQESSNYSSYDRGYSSSSYDDQDGYTDYPSAYSHPAGQQCYKVKTRGY
jgi:hypothetical protein